MNDDALFELDEALGEQVREELGDEKLVSMYQDMTLIRRFEQEAGRAYQTKKVRGFCHLYTGQEAVAVGAINTLADQDYSMTAYRDHGHALAVGMEPNVVMAELFGKEDGSSKGKGGSMHLFDVEKNFYGGWAIVGGHIPLAAGIGFAIDYRDEEAVCLCFFGEGAIHQGVFHEAANMVENWDLPVVYVIEDNSYAMGTSIERASAVTDLKKKAASYDMRADDCDGQDIFDVYTTVQEAVEHARETGEPSLLQIDTYRYEGHSMTDPATYRDKDEIQEEQQRDPIQRFSNWMIDNDVLSQDDLDEIDEEMKARAQESVEFAEQADFPDESELTEDIYVDWPWEIR